MAQCVPSRGEEAAGTLGALGLVGDLQMLQAALEIFGVSVMRKRNLA